MELLVTEVSARLWLNANCARNHRGAMRNAARTVALARARPSALSRPIRDAHEWSPRSPRSPAREREPPSNTPPPPLEGEEDELESFTRSEEASSAEDASFGERRRAPARSPSRSASASSSRSRSGGVVGVKRAGLELEAAPLGRRRRALADDGEAAPVDLPRDVHREEDDEQGVERT